MMGTLLTIKNDFSWLLFNNEGADRCLKAEVAAQEFKHKIWTGLRFRDRGYFHNRRYKMRLWDGFVDFFNKTNGRFLTGLLPEVTAALKHEGIEYTVDDQRHPINFQCNQINSSFLHPWLPCGRKPFDLYDYQVDYINQIIKHQRGVVYAPTSSGKSLIIVGMLKALPPGLPTLVLQNRNDLAEQNYDELVAWGVPRVGRLWGNKPKPDIVTVANIMSIAKIEKLLPHIRVLIVDEVHDMMSKLPIATYKRLKECSVRVALSATPFKFGGADKVQKYRVKGFFGPVFRTKSTPEGILTTKELQGRGNLSKSICDVYPIHEPSLPYEIYQDAITKGIAESIHFHNVVERLARKQAGRTLILVDRLSHGDALKARLPASLWVQGKDDRETRKYVLNELKVAKGNVVAIATQQIFNTGINVFLHNLINAAGGQAEHLIIQRMGRGLRPADDKTILRYYDFLFLINDYLEEHSQKRIKILQEEGHEVVVHDRIDF